MVRRVPKLIEQSATQENAPAPLVISYLLLRFLIGVLAVLLPLVLILVNWLLGHGFQPSISGYYYTPMRDIYIGTLCAIGVFLISYYGYDLADRLITDCAGLGTILAAFLPTTPGYLPSARQVIVGDFHIGFACATFVLLAVMAFRFAKRERTPAGLPFWQRVRYAFGFTGPGVSTRPRWATVVYRVSGCAILICVILAWPLSGVTYSLLVLETIIMASFGLSWFVKGRKLFPVATAPGR
jgi:hypothetical protein